MDKDRYSRTLIGQLASNYITVLTQKVTVLFSMNEISWCVCMYVCMYVCMCVISNICHPMFA